MHELLCQVAQRAEFSLVTMDSLVPVLAIVAGVAMAVIQIYNTTRNRAFDLTTQAIEARLADCERYRDQDRAKHEATRNALTEAMGRISELTTENVELKAKHAGPQPD